MDVTLTWPRNQRRTCGRAWALRAEIKKGISEKTPLCRASPRIPPSPKTVSPRKRFPAPLAAASYADIQRIVHPAGSSPEFRDSSWQDRLCRREDRSPLFTITIPHSERGSKRKMRPGKRKNSAGRDFSRGGQVCCTSLNIGRAETGFGHGKKPAAEIRRMRPVAPTALHADGNTVPEKETPHPGRTTDAAG